MGVSCGRGSRQGDQQVQKLSSTNGASMSEELKEARVADLQSEGWRERKGLRSIQWASEVRVRTLFTVVWGPSGRFCVGLNFSRIEFCSKKGHSTDDS